MSLRPEDVTLSLAIEDALPVLLAGAGLVWLVRAVRPTGDPWVRWGTAGAVLVVLGGLAKVSWKLVAATTGDDLAGLDAALFPLLGSGFALVVAALTGRAAVLAAVPLALGAALALQATWPCLVLTVVGSTATLVFAVRAALRRRDLLSAGLFAVTLVAAYGLVPLAAQETQTLALQWIEQSVNTVAQACFALAAWRLRRTPMTSPTAPTLIRSTA